MPIHGYPGNIITANPTAPSVSSASGVWTTEQQLQNMTAGNWPMAATQISRSLRFNSADSAYLNRTFSSAGDRQKWTWSGWVKLGAITGSRQLFSGGSGVSDQIFISDPPKLFVYLDGANRIESTPLYRDPSAWYHIVVQVDTTQATASNRTRVYVNGVQITDFTGTAITQNNNTKINDAVSHTIGRYAASAAEYFSGYMTEINFIDGSALTPSSFGETDADTGVWKPKAYSGSYGTNGFYLKFADNSGTTSTTLGKDSSGNSNNWTPNNFSVTAGAGNDSLVDSPTQYGTDTGVGGEVRGNYSTFNPLDFWGTTGLSNGNLDVSAISLGICGTIKVTSGKWYFEFRKNANGDNQLGIASGNAYGATSNIGVSFFRRAWRDDNGTPVWLTDAGNAGSGTAQSLATGDILGVALDLDNNAVYFAKNNTWMNSGVPTSGASKTGAIWTDLSGGTWQIFAGGNSNGCYTSLNAGQRPFAYTAPSGFKALCTQNLPTPTIGATSTTQADNYFNVVARTFTAATAVITGLGFSPDWLWFKRRNTAASHSLYDRLRGTNARLLTNGTNAQITTTSAELTSFDSDGFTVGSDPGSISINSANGDTGVVWCWRANGAGGSNTSGTITSTVSANTTAGFSVVTYTGNGSASTVGHGLGVAPSMIILKDRSTITDWRVYHSLLNSGVSPANYTLKLNTTSAQAADSTIWNNTAPTSTVFSIGANVEINANSNLYVAYCFAAIAGYSAFGYYTGNGSTDGPFVYTGFRPRYVLVKSFNATENWATSNTAVSTYNAANAFLRPDESSAESTGAMIMDFLSNGFKLRNSDTKSNGSGYTYIYAAFAESPFKYALAR